MTDKMYMGSALCAVDADGGVILPSFVRGPLALRSDGAAMLLGSHEVDTCLTGCDPTQAVVIEEECRRRRMAEEGSKAGASHARARRIFGLLHSVPIDSGGRFVLPDLLRRRARIRDMILVVGTGDAFEVWNVNVARYSHDAGMRTLATLSLETAQAA